MKRLWWNLRTAWHLYYVGGMPFRFGWQVACGSDDSYIDDVPPWEAAHDEMSYWSE